MNCFSLYFLNLIITTHTGPTVQCTYSVQYGVHFSCGKFFNRLSSAARTDNKYDRKLLSLFSPSVSSFPQLPFLLFIDGAAQSKETHTTESFSSLSLLSLLRSPIFRHHTVTLKVTNTTESFSLSFAPSVSSLPKLSFLLFIDGGLNQKKVTHMTESFFYLFLHYLFSVPYQSFSQINLKGTTATA